MMRAVAVAALASVLALGLAACGERPQVVNYKQGTYQGKPDTPPYANAPYNNNKDDWERAIRTRQQSQNEYKRTGGRV
jgi:predicted outer membrane protein